MYSTDIIVVLVRYINMFLSNTWMFLIFLTIVRNVFCIDSFRYHEPELFSLYTKNRTGTKTDADFSELFGIDQKRILHQHTFSNVQKEKVEVLSKLLKVHVDQLRDVSDEVISNFLIQDWQNNSTGIELFFFFFILRWNWFSSSMRQPRLV